jgi:hypothetical protein
MAILNQSVCEYFFGLLFNYKTAEAAVEKSLDEEIIGNELRESIKNNRPHLGIQIINYNNVDTGLTVTIVMRNPKEMSGVSFFLQSHHRLFGGQSLICVPLVFCSPVYNLTGDHIVYRHTFKEPNYTDQEMEYLMNSTDSEVRLKAFAYTKGRIGYKTIPGMSYVGITGRSWQKRFMEHIESAMEEGSKLKFHEALRSMQGRKVICVHDISGFCLQKTEALEIERHLVKTSSLHPLGLNMR